MTEAQRAKNRRYLCGRRMRTTPQSSRVLQYPLRSGKTLWGGYDCCNQHARLERHQTGALHCCWVRQAGEGQRALCNALGAQAQAWVCQEARSHQTVRRMHVPWMYRLPDLQRLLQPALLEDPKVYGGPQSYVRSSPAVAQYYARSVSSLRRATNNPQWALQSGARLLFGSQPRYRSTSRLALQQLQSRFGVLPQRQERESTEESYRILEQATFENSRLTNRHSAPIACARGADHASMG